MNTKIQWKTPWRSNQLVRPVVESTTKRYVDWLQWPNVEAKIFEVIALPKFLPVSYFQGVNRNDQIQFEWLHSHMYQRSIELAVDGCCNLTLDKLPQAQRLKFSNEKRSVTVIFGRQRKDNQSASMNATHNNKMFQI